jgi:hypothetical protein
MSENRRKVNYLNDANVRQIFTYDHVTGILTWNYRYSEGPAWNGRNAWKIAGHIGDCGYRIVKLRGEKYRAHRIAWLYMTGAWPDHDVDHANGDRADNRFKNLRSAKPGDNNQNSAKQKRATSSRFIGVSYRKSDGAWVAQICSGGKSVYLGGFASEHAARDAYRAAKSRMHTFQPALRQNAEVLP